MTNPDLAALSEALPLGKWYADCDQVWEVNGLQICDTVAPNMCEKAAFIVALANEYRAGRLVQIDEGMRERVWHDYRFQAACHRYAHNGGSSEAIAAAAIAAMGGAK